MINDLLLNQVNSIIYHRRQRKEQHLAVVSIAIHFMIFIQMCGFTYLGVVKNDTGITKHQKTKYWLFQILTIVENTADMTFLTNIEGFPNKKPWIKTLIF